MHKELYSQYKSSNKLTRIRPNIKTHKNHSQQKKMHERRQPCDYVQTFYVKIERSIIIT